MKRLLNFPLSLKYNLGEGYDIKRAKDNFSLVSKSNTPNGNLKTVIDKKIEDNSNILMPKLFFKENYSGENFNVFKGVNISYGSKDDLENTIGVKEFLNQASLTNVVFASDEYITEMENALDSLWDVERNPVPISTGQILDSFRQHYLKCKQFDFVAVIDLIKNLDLITKDFREKNNYLELIREKILRLDVVYDEIEMAVSELNKVDLYDITHKNRFMLSTNKLMLINENYEYVGDRFSDVFSELISNVKNTKEILKERCYLSCNGMDFLLIREDDSKDVSPVSYTLSDVVDNFIDKSFGKLKETNEMEGELSEAESKLTNIQNISIYSSIPNEALESHMFDISMLYRRKVNICFIAQSKAFELLNQEYFGRIGVLVHKENAVYLVKKAIDRGVISKYTLGAFPYKISRALVTNDYKIKI